MELHKGLFNPIIKYLNFFFLLFLSIGPIFAMQGKYAIRNYTSTDYKAGIQNIDFAQNRDLSIYVANNLGVLSFNGIDWSIHTFSSGEKIRSLAFDELSNRLYVGSQGQFGYFDKEWTYISLLNLISENDLNFDEVWDVFVLNSKVYFCTFQGIYIYDGSSITVVKHPNGLDRSFLVDGNLYTQSQNGRLLELKGKELISSYSQKNTNEVIAGITRTEDGLLLIYNSGSIEYTTSFGGFSRYNDLVQSLKGRYVNHVLPLSDSRLVISTQTAGLFLYDLQKQQIENISKDDGLLTNACLRTFQDYSGNLWVGMQNGIAFINVNSPIRFTNQEINIQGSGYDAFDTPIGTYYTTSNGIYFLAKGSTESQFLAGTEGPAYGLQRINSKLYACHHTGLFLLEKDGAKRLANMDGLWQIKPLKSRPEYAIGGTYSGLHLFKANENRVLEPVQKIKGFEETSRFFEEDQRGRIWVSQFYKGLYQLTLSDDLMEAVVEQVSKNYEYPIDEQIVLSQIDNELYLATREGLYKLDQNTNKIVKPELFSKEIGNQHIYLMTQDNKKNVHFFSNQMVGFFKQISTNNYVFIPSSLYKFRYSFNNDLLNISMNVDEGVLFNANEGFIQYQPELEERVSTKVPLLIKELINVTDDQVLFSRKEFEEKYQVLPELNIPYNTKMLQFKMEAFQFSEVDNQQFRYFLKGFEEDYEEWVNSPIKEYSNLQEGSYEFYVQTRDYLGELVTSQPMRFKIDPPLHKSLIAKAFYFILALLLLFLVFRRQKVVYSLKAKEVEEEKQRELDNKQQELIEVERQKEQEVQRLEEDKMKSELRHLNNLLAASTMNLVVKNEFIEKIKEKLKNINRKESNKASSATLEQLVKEIDTTLRLQEDWKLFEHHFDQVHGDFLSRLRTEFLDLTPNEQKLCAFLRLNLNTKDIANLMGISLRGVEVARYRLRKKLNLNKGQNLSKFILEY